MNGKNPHKSHWKELVAQEAARRTSPKETEGNQTEVPADAPAPKAPALSLTALYRQYFHRYRYGWLAAAIFIQAVILVSVFSRDEGRPGRRAVYGEVTVAGKPVLNGSISLLPMAGNSGPAANTSIVNGEYHFTVQTGPHGGPHRVLIDSFTPPGQADVSAPAQPIRDMKKVTASAVQYRNAGPGPPTEQTEGSTRGHWELEYVVPEGIARKDFGL